MAPPIKPGKVRHLHIDPYVRVMPDNNSASVDGDARLDRALAWYDAQPSGTRTRLCWELIVAAVNGELGIAPAVSMDDGDAEENKSALSALLENMVLNEE